MPGEPHTSPELAGHAGTALTLVSVALTGVVLRVFAWSLSLTRGSRFGLWWLRDRESHGNRNRRCA